MKTKNILFTGLFMLFVGLLLTRPSFAAMYTTYQLGNLEHGSLYSWGFNFNLPANEYVSGAYLFVEDLNNDTEPDPDDLLSIYLLDNPRLGIRNYFPDTKILLTTYSDDNGYWDEETYTHIGWYKRDGHWYFGWHTHTYSVYENPPVDFYYSFTQEQIDTLTSYAADNGRIGLGFAPECHFKDKDLVKFCIKTEVIPEPATMSLFGLGLLGLLPRLRKRAAHL